MTNHQLATKARKQARTCVIIAVIAFFAMAVLVTHGINIPGIIAAVILFIAYKRWLNTTAAQRYHEELHPSLHRE